MITRNALVSLIILLAGLAAGFLASRTVEDTLAPEVHEKDLSELTRRYPQPDSGSMAIPLRMVDMGGVGITPDTLKWGNNYSHHTHLFEEVFLAGPPYIDTTAFRSELAKWSLFSGQMRAYGFNAVSVPWFLELINFDQVENGKQIYGDASPYRMRHRNLKPMILQWMQLASDSGLATYLQTDMVALTSPLRSYLERRFGSLDTEDPEFWGVFRMGLEEIFRNYPRVEGLIIRIGEAGTVYNQPGWDYTSELAVRTGRGVQLMLSAFLEAAEHFDRTIIFRTWSVGVGEVGDMHTDPETYRQVLGPIRSDHLVISTKYGNGDFYSWLPLNRTLFTGDHRRMMEFQARREFEGFGSMPNFVGSLHQSALQSALHYRGVLEGAWVWTQSGGPLRAGPLSLYPFTGFNTVTDLNVYASARLLNDPHVSIDSVLYSWTASRFGNDSLLLAHLTRFFLQSHGVLRYGLYISDFARYDIRALGLEPPPMLWIFEWDILGASSSVFSQIYRVTRQDLDRAIGEGFQAVRGAIGMKDLLLEVRDRVETNRPEFDQLIRSIDYEIEVLRLLDYYRRYMLQFYHWLDTGDPEALSTHSLAMGQFRAVMDYHVEKYGNDLNTIGFQFNEAKQGMEVAENSRHAVRWSRFALGLILFLVILGIPGAVRDRAHLRFSGTLLFDSLFRPYRINGMRHYHGTWRLAVMMFLLYLLSLVAFSSFSSMVFPVAVGTLGLLFPFLLALLAHSGRDYRKIWISLMAPKLLVMILLLSVVAVRGPMHFWYLLWSSSLFRAIWISIFGLLLFRKFHIYLILSRQWSRRNRLGSAAMCLLVLGIQLLILGAAIQLYGLENSLTRLNDDLLVLPGGLSRIMGITIHLGIPEALPLWIIYFSLSLVVVSLIVFWFNRRSYRTISAVGRN